MIHNQNIEDIALKYCDNCFSYQLSYSADKIFHSIFLNHLLKQAKSSDIITPRGNIKDMISNSGCKNYKTYFDRNYVRLGNLVMSGLAAGENQIQLEFNINELENTLKDMMYIDFDVWEQIGFHNFDDDLKERKKLENKLFLKKYSAKKWTEMLVDYLPLRLTRRVLVHSAGNIKKVTKIFKSRGINNPKVISAKALSDVYLEHVKFINNSAGSEYECSCSLQNSREIRLIN